MEAIFFNLFGDAPVVTRTWTIGCIGFSVLAKSGLIDNAKTLYNYDLVFHKRQYQRILYSLFNYGELNWMTLLNIFITANHLTLLENSMPTKRRFMWLVFVMLSMMLTMSSYAQPSASLGNILHENLVYYTFKKRHNEMNIPFLGGNEIATAILPLYTYFIMYYIYERSLIEISMNFLPGHIMYYLDSVIEKLYGIDLCKTPYDFWIERRN